MRLRPHRQEVASGAGGEGPQEARGSAEPAVGREGRAHWRQEARGNWEGQARKKVYALGKAGGGQMWLRPQSHAHLAKYSRALAHMT